MLNKKVFHRKNGFTLMEIMIVFSIIGILIATLYPAYSIYLKRGRDSARIVDMDALMKIHAAYFTDKENYPAHDNGCVNELLLDKYLNGRPIRDQLSTKSNGCGIIGRYGYGMATTLLQGPNFYDVLMIMEMPNGGNYSGDISGFTGTLTQSAYFSGTLYTVKGDGPYFVKIQ